MNLQNLFQSGASLPTLPTQGLGSGRSANLPTGKDRVGVPASISAVGSTFVGESGKTAAVEQLSFDAILEQLAHSADNNTADANTSLLSPVNTAIQNRISLSLGNGEVISQSDGLDESVVASDQLITLDGASIEQGVQTTVEPAVAQTDSVHFLSRELEADPAGLETNTDPISQIDLPGSIESETVTQFNTLVSHRQDSKPIGSGVAIGEESEDPSLSEIEASFDSPEGDTDAVQRAASESNSNGRTKSGSNGASEPKGRFNTTTPDFRSNQNRSENLRPEELAANRVERKEGHPLLTEPRNQPSETLLSNTQRSNGQSLSGQAANHVTQPLATNADGQRPAESPFSTSASSYATNLNQSGPVDPLAINSEAPLAPLESNRDEPKQLSLNVNAPSGLTPQQAERNSNAVVQQSDAVRQAGITANESVPVVGQAGSDINRQQRATQPSVENQSVSSSRPTNANQNIELPASLQENSSSNPTGSPALEKGAALVGNQVNPISGSIQSGIHREEGIGRLTPRSNRSAQETGVTLDSLNNVTNVRLERGIAASPPVEPVARSVTPTSRSTRGIQAYSQTKQALNQTASDQGLAQSDIAVFDSGEIPNQPTTIDANSALPGNRATLLSRSKLQRTAQTATADSDAPIQTLPNPESAFASTTFDDDSIGASPDSTRLVENFRTAGPAMPFTQTMAPIASTAFATPIGAETLVDSSVVNSSEPVQFFEPIQFSEATAVSHVDSRGADLGISQRLTGQILQEQTLTPSGNKGWSEIVSGLIQQRQSEANSEANLTRIKVEIDPPELGEIAIQITKSLHKTVATLAVTNEFALHQLSASIQTLQSSLEAMGVEFHQVDYPSDDSTPEQADENDRDFGQNLDAESQSQQRQNRVTGQNNENGEPASVEAKDVKLKSVHVVDIVV